MRHLLIVRLSALGDAAILAPIAVAYAKANPELKITVAGPPLIKPLFEGENNLHYVGIQKKQSIGIISKLLQDIDADAIADLHHIRKVRLAIHILRIRQFFSSREIIPLRHIHKGYLSRLRMLLHISTKDRKPQWQRYADVLKRLGLKEPEFSPTTIKPIEDSSKKKIVGIAPFAQHKGKIWPLQLTEQLTKILSEKGYHVLLFGSKDEAKLLSPWADHLQNVQNVAGTEDFRNEIELIKKLNVMVSMDSANMHFASALGIPVVSIWGATHPNFGFYGFGQSKENALFANMKCQPCSSYGKKPCRYADYRCLWNIKPQHVVERIEALLSSETI